MFHVLEFDFLPFGVQVFNSSGKTTCTSKVCPLPIGCCWELRI